MTLDALGDVNYGAVAVAAVAWFAFGGLWYARPVFGKKWGEALGISMDAGPSPMLFVATYVGYFVMALALAYVGLFTGVDTAAEGIGLGLLGSLGFVAWVLIINGMYQQRAWAVTWIDVGNNVIGFALMGLILGIWT